jgi:hypothetical protein
MFTHPLKDVPSKVGYLGRGKEKEIAQMLCCFSTTAR